MSETPIGKPIVIGAGPAGLTAAWQLVLSGRAPTVLEEDSHFVGGLARSAEFMGHRFDVGPHRFYTKSAFIQQCWDEILGDEFIEVSRLTRIFYDGKFFPYPISLGATLRGMGFWRSAKMLKSCLMARAFPRRPVTSFADWIVNRFGEELYRTFFKTYTEKVWGIPCEEIDKDWAAQRIRGLSLLGILRNAILPRSRGKQATSLIDRFPYPRRGAGQFWERLAEVVTEGGGTVEMGQRVERILHAEGRVIAVETAAGDRFEGDEFFVTMTLESFVNALDPPPPEAVLNAGRSLRHRDFLTVTLIVPTANLFPDQWIYIHDPGVRVARITNSSRWSSELSPDPSTTSLCLEYFCDRHEELWSMDDAALVELAADELRRIGFCREVPELPGVVHRYPDAYPVYDGEYRGHRDTLRKWIGDTLSNVYPAGRKGLHNYNSQDHAMMTAILSVRNHVEGTQFNVWAVNTEEEYAEEGAIAEGLEERLVPRRAKDV